MAFVKRIVVGVARETEADLVVVGMREAPCPVVVVRHD